MGYCIMEMCERRWNLGKDEVWGKSRRRRVFLDFKYWFKKKGASGDESKRERRKGVLSVGVQ